MCTEFNSWVSVCVSTDSGKEKIRKMIKQMGQIFTISDSVSRVYSCSSCYFYNFSGGLKLFLNRGKYICTVLQ